MPDSNPLRAIVERLLEKRREEEKEALSTLQGMINGLSQTVESISPGVLLRTQASYEARLDAITDPIERAAELVHGGVAALMLLGALIEDPKKHYGIELSELLTRNANSAASAVRSEDTSDKGPPS